MWVGVFAILIGGCVATNTKVCVEHLSPSYSDSSLIGVVPIPGRNDIVVGFSQGGDLIQINTSTGDKVGSTVKVPLRTSGGEQGLLSVAFKPDFATSGKFYTWANTVATSRLDLAIDEWTCTLPSTLTGCTRTGPVLEVAEPYSNHNGGTLLFDPNRPTILFLTLGDGGAACDVGNNAANSKRLLGKVLRIDVGSSAAGRKYTIPPTNPLAKAPKSMACGKALKLQHKKKVGLCQEVWAVGLRNPFRCSLDRGGATEMYCGDVGQGIIEEVDVIPTAPGGALLNYGWDVFEGTQGARGSGCTGTSQTCPFGTTKTLNNRVYTCPIAEETHDDGWSAIIGGYVCRGCGDSGLEGRYLYADFVQQQSLRSLNLANTSDKVAHQVGLCTTPASCKVQAQAQPIGTDWMVFSFGQDNNGKVYLVHANNGLYRIVDSSLC